MFSRQNFFNSTSRFHYTRKTIHRLIQCQVPSTMCALSLGRFLYPSKSITPFWSLLQHFIHFTERIPDSTNHWFFASNTFPTPSIPPPIFSITHFFNRNRMTFQFERGILNGTLWMDSRHGVPSIGSQFKSFRDFLLFDIRWKISDSKKFYFHWRFLVGEFPQAFSRTHHSASRHFWYFQNNCIVHNSCFQYSGSKLPQGLPTIFQRILLFR